MSSETNSKEKIGLKKLARKLKEVHEELQQHIAVLETFLAAPEAEWESLVVADRGFLTTNFFAHIENLIRANHDDEKRADGEFKDSRLLFLFVDATGI